MSASLVGSEMCIRDRPSPAARTAQSEPHRTQARPPARLCASERRLSSAAPSGAGPRGLSATFP
eukprot:4646479-Alexandrium_andersonii.AAC.1